jgi:hypothetical protein
MIAPIYGVRVGAATRIEILQRDACPRYVPAILFSNGREINASFEIEGHAKQHTACGYVVSEIMAVARVSSSHIQPTSF